MTGQEGFVDLGSGRRTHYVLAGDGPDIVCFPGNGCSVGDFDPVVERLSERFRFVSVDPPGGGAHGVA